MKNVRHFLRLADCTKNELQSIIQRATTLKINKHEKSKSCEGLTLAMIFELSSTRTRVAFETGFAQLGGNSLFLNANDLQLGRGEPIGDSARIISSMVDLVMIRSLSQSKIESFALESSVPVINGMSSELHPCQLLADMQTYIENKGPIDGKRVAFIGDGYNMCHSFIEASQIFDFELRICTPATHRPSEPCLANTANVRLVDSPSEAVRNADLVVTDVWSSMGHEGEDRLSAFDGLQVNEQLLDQACPDVMFLHCLPAHRGEEVNDSVLDDERSFVWEEAENRLHSQKALMEFLLEERRSS